MFGDGLGRVVTLGDRDCSLQRRHQKVVEEAPAPGLPDDVRALVASSARTLAESVDYRSAGTVEFVYDAEREEAAFLEVNTRLQVEHPVTEAVFGVDLVAWMIRLAQGDTAVVDTPLAPRGAAVEARVYAENPDRDHLPSAGTITAFEVPDGVRVDTWVEPGLEVSTHYDPLLAKVITAGGDRESAWAALGDALAGTRLTGIATNLGLLRTIVHAPEVAAALHHTGTLAHLRDETPRIEVLRPGMLTTVQDWPGRTGLWHVGIPPSGPMDDLSFRLGNTALGNPEGAPGLECTMAGPELRFVTGATVVVTGAPAAVTLDDAPVPQWEPVEVPAGGVLAIGAPTSRHATYLLVRGGLDVPQVLGSAATFDLGRDRRHARASRCDRATCWRSRRPTGRRSAPVPADRPARRSRDAWQIGALEGPHAAPEFFTPGDIAEFYATTWAVHFNSARTGVRLVGPKPHLGATRRRRGRAAPVQHPRHPVRGRRRRLHRRPADPARPRRPVARRLHLPGDGRARPAVEARPAASRRHRAVRAGRRGRGGRAARRGPRRAPRRDAGRRTTTAASSPARTATPRSRYRRSGDDNLLVEYGAMTLDLASRMRVHALAQQVQERVDHDGLRGIVDLTPGHPLAAAARRPRAPAAAHGARPGPRDRGRAAGHHRPRRAQPARSTCRWLGRPGHPRGDRAVHGRRPRRRPVVPVEHRVHPPDQRPGLASTTCTARSSTRRLPGARPRRRLPRRAGRDPARPPAPPGHHEVQPGAHVDPAERGRHRRRLPLHLRDGGPGRLPVRRPHHPGVVHARPAQAVRAGYAVAAAVLRPHPLVPGRAPRSCSTCAPTWPRVASTLPSSRARSRSRSTSVPGRERRRRSRPSARGRPGVRRRARRLGGRGRVRPRGRARRARRRSPAAEVPEGCEGVEAPFVATVFRVDVGPATWSSAASSCSRSRR